MMEKVYMKMGYIYLRTNKVNGKKYVGQTTNLEVRQHNWKNLSERYAGNAINNARAKYGIECFDFEILVECNDEKLDYLEKHYIEKLNTKRPYGYNLTDGGNTTRGYTHTEENRKKMSELKKGCTPWNKGKKDIYSEETKEVLSQKNRNNTKTSKPVLQIDKETNKVIAEFPSIREVERKTGYLHSPISRCCQNKPHFKTAYGFKWRYKENGDNQ